MWLSYTVFLQMQLSYTVVALTCWGRVRVGATPSANIMHNARMGTSARNINGMKLGLGMPRANTPTDRTIESLDVEFIAHSKLPLCLDNSWTNH